MSTYSHIDFSTEVPDKQMRNASTIGATVREARETLEMTQAELARQANVSRRLVIRIENGHETEMIAALKAIASALDIDISITGNTSKSA